MKSQKTSPKTAKKNSTQGERPGADAIIAFCEFYCISSEAGLNPVQALDYCARFCTNPLSGELRACVNEVGIGSTLSQALIHVSDRVGSYYFGLAVRAILLSIRTGASSIPYLRALSSRLSAHPIGKPLPAMQYEVINQEEADAG
jgi:hypothetical protein